jgi:hypothetical protein
MNTTNDHEFIGIEIIDQTMYSAEQCGSDATRYAETIMRAHQENELCGDECVPTDRMQSKAVCTLPKGHIGMHSEGPHQTARFWVRRIERAGHKP